MNILVSIGMEQNVQNLSSWQGTSGRCLTYSMFTAVPRMEIYCWDMHLISFFEENNLHWSELWYRDCLFVLTANSSIACSWCTPFIVWSREIFVNVSVKKPYGPCDEIASEIQKSIFVNRFSSTVWIGHINLRCFLFSHHRYFSYWWNLEISFKIYYH